MYFIIPKQQRERGFQIGVAVSAKSLYGISLALTLFLLYVFRIFLFAAQIA